MQNTKKIVVTGPESTGKSALIKSLAETMGCPYSKEYARAYLESKGGNYKKEDLFEIALGQLQNNTFSVGHPVQLCDTDLLTIKIWSEFKFNYLDPRITKLFKENLPDYYLLCDTDIPWEPDPLRENPNDREILKELYIKEIRATQVPFRVISGDFEMRKNTALSIIYKIL
jgi:NadR type nicotinamide-nucleotide adenylyltransferase